MAHLSFCGIGARGGVRVGKDESVGCVTGECAGWGEGRGGGREGLDGENGAGGDGGGGNVVSQCDGGVGGRVGDCYGMAGEEIGQN